MRSCALVVNGRSPQHALPLSTPPLSHVDLAFDIILHQLGDSFGSLAKSLEAASLEDSLIRTSEKHVLRNENLS